MSKEASTMKFTFISDQPIDGSKITLEFETSNWVNTFDYYLQFLRGSGFYIDENIRLSFTSDSSKED